MLLVVLLLLDQHTHLLRLRGFEVKSGVDEVTRYVLVIGEVLLVQRIVTQVTVA